MGGIVLEGPSIVPSGQTCGVAAILHTQAYNVLCNVSFSMSHENGFGWMY